MNTVIFTSVLMRTRGDLMRIEKSEYKMLDLISSSFAEFVGPLVEFVFKKHIFQSNLDEDWNIDYERWCISQTVLCSVTRESKKQSWKDVCSAKFEVCSKLVDESICKVLDVQVLIPSLDFESALLDDLVYCITRCILDNDNKSRSLQMISFLLILAINFQSPSELIEILTEVSEELMENGGENSMQILMQIGMLPGDAIVTPILAALNFKTRLERDVMTYLEDII